MPDAKSLPLEVFVDNSIGPAMDRTPPGEYAEIVRLRTGEKWALIRLSDLEELREKAGEE